MAGWRSMTACSACASIGTTVTVPSARASNGDGSPSRADSPKSSPGPMSARTTSRPDGNTEPRRTRPRTTRNSDREVSPWYTIRVPSRNRRGREAAAASLVSTVRHASVAHRHRGSDGLRQPALARARLPGHGGRATGRRGSDGGEGWTGTARPGPVVLAPVEAPAEAARGVDDRAAVHGGGVDRSRGRGG